MRYPKFRQTKDSKFKELKRVSKSKYRNIKQTYKGYSYDSKKEAQFAMWLDSELKQGRIKKWDRQTRYDLFGENGNRICYYKADFVITHNNGTIEIVDVKSKITTTPYFMLKWKLMKDKFKDDGNVILTISK